jgi:hypothetical protein
MPSVKPPETTRTRPWYLVIALLAAWVLGVNGTVNGCRSIAEFHSDIPAERTTTAESTKDAEREAFARLHERQVATRHEHRDRVYPFAVASFVLGFAMFVLTARAMGGRAAARALLVQVLVVRGAVGVAEYIVTRDVLLAETDHWKTYFEETRTDPALAARAEAAAEGMRFVPALSVAFHTGALLLIVFALTRPRARDYFAASGAPSFER